ncbi:MAG: hypothetical protein JRJ80_15290 [Deltaproteobacteria bacterium]|nr:hypothetical protein [Deltaproteobacteria bacterium]
MLRTLLNFFLIGGLLFGAKVFVEGRRVEGPEITVVVQADATQAEVEKTIQEAILLNEARRYGWDRHDPIVFTHLVRNIRSCGPGFSTVRASHSPTCLRTACQVAISSMRISRLTGIGLSERAGFAFITCS